MITNVEKKSLIAHLMRRAGFGCNFDQIEELISFKNLVSVEKVN